MKRIVLASVSAAALTIASQAAAQTAPSNPQDPSYPDEPAACAGVTGECSVVDQRGNGGTAVVTQTGSGNVSNVQQAASSIEALADVKQSGTNASSYVAQSGGTAGARNRAYVDQKGDGAESVILQGSKNRLGASVIQDGDSTSFIEQFGRSSETEVRQRGDGNDSVVFQIANNSALGSLSNASIGVDQLGNDNSAFFYQGDISDTNEEGNFRGSVKQTGDGNTSTTTQLSDIPAHPLAGQLSYATTRQIGNGNDSIILQTGITDARVGVLQQGDDNFSDVMQQNNLARAPGDGSQVDVQQFGNKNDSTVNQNSGLGSATVSQTSLGINPTSPRDRDNRFDGGTDTVRGNFSNIAQSGDGETNAGLMQSGQLNRSDIRQSNDSGVSSATVAQNGIFNNSDIRQTAASTAIVTQGGDYGDNDSLVEQTADGASATVTQYGNTTAPTYFPSNQSLISQASAAIADVEQTGQQNVSDILQDAAAAGALATVRQTNPNAAAGAGDVNTSAITQSALTSAFVEQIGEGNDSIVNQTGTNAVLARNTTAAAEVSQLGDDGFSRVGQSGTGNEARLMQLAGSSEAHSEIDQSGSDNLADVMQGGFDNASYVTQSGSGNTATVTQTSDSNVSTVTQAGMANTATVTQGN